MDVRAIREAVADRLSTLPGVRVSAFPPDQVNPGNSAALVVSNGDPYVQWNESFSERCLGRVNLTVTVHVPYNNPRTAWDELDSMLSVGSAHPRSVIDALMFGGDRTLNGVCENIGVDDIPAPQVLTVEGGARYLTADIPVTIFARRS